MYVVLLGLHESCQPNLSPIHEWLGVWRGRGRNYNNALGLQLGEPALGLQLREPPALANQQEQPKLIGHARRTGQLQQLLLGVELPVLDLNHLVGVVGHPRLYCLADHQSLTDECSIGLPELWPDTVWPLQPAHGQQSSGVHMERYSG